MIPSGTKRKLEDEEAFGSGEDFEWHGLRPEPCTLLAIHYRQESRPLCTIFSLLSALYLYGDLLVCGFLMQHIDQIERMTTSRSPETATCEQMEALSEKTMILLMQKDPKRCPRIGILFQLTSSREFKFWECRWKGNTGVIEDTCERLEALLLLKNVTIVLVQLVGSDKSAGHTVCIVKKSDLCYILDSNEEYAMRLTARNLAFATASRHCIGWQAVLLFTAKEPLRNSDTRLKRCLID